MTLKTYHGSCHCGAVHFACDIDLAEGTGRCNCSYCSKIRAWGVNIKPDAFRLISGEDALSDYQFGTKSGYHRFCRHCGIKTYSYANVAELGGEVISIALASLDDATPAELMEGPLRFSNGRDNAWWNAPDDVRHM